MKHKPLPDSHSASDDFDSFTDDQPFVNFVNFVPSHHPPIVEYEIKSDRTDHVALHKGRALRLLSH